MRTPEAAARCEDVVKTYRLPGSEVRALAGVTVTFPRSEISAVVGPSGSGKSSLLRVLSGLDRPTSGRVEVDGTVVSSASASARRRLRRDRVGFVFQRPSDNFLPYLTVLDHLHIAARGPSGRPFDIEGMLDLLGVGARAEHLPAELSGGEQQRAAFAQAYVGGAGLVLADEPTAELDARSASVLADAARALTELGVTVVVATHDRGLAGAAAEVARLDHGRLVGPATRGSTWSAPTRPERPHRWRPTPVPGASGNVWRPPPERRPEAPAPDEPARPGEAVATLRGLAKRYRRGDELVHAVEGVSLRLGRGEVVGLVGRSGSGKTTLLNLLAGWEEPDEGEIAVPWAGARPAWSDVSFVPQHLGLVDELTLGENVELPARLAGRLEEAAPVAARLLEGLGITHLRDRYPREASLGEQQRASVARAAVLSPRLLLADEPTGHQDDASARAVFEVFRQASHGGSCCVVATHDEAIVSSVSRTLSMRDGRIEG